MPHLVLLLLLNLLDNAVEALQTPNALDHIADNPKPVCRSPGVHGMLLKLILGKDDGLKCVCAQETPEEVRLVLEAGGCPLGANELLRELLCPD